METNANPPGVDEAEVVPKENPPAKKIIIFVGPTELNDKNLVEKVLHLIPGLHL